MLCKIVDNRNKKIPNISFPLCLFISQVFYSLPKADRVKMLLETACHELYLTTELTAGDIVHQNNFGSFRVFLAFLKRRVLSLSVMARDSVAEKERQRRQRFSLNRLTNSYQDEINKVFDYTIVMYIVLIKTRFHIIIILFILFKYFI